MTYNDHHLFVSYARRDLDVRTLRILDRRLRQVGLPYIDDLHGIDSVDRTTTVLAALARAHSFVGVLTQNYLQTPWTAWELDRARQRGIPIQFVSVEADVGPLPSEASAALFSTVSATWNSPNALASRYPLPASSTLCGTRAVPWPGSSHSSPD